MIVGRRVILPGVAPLVGAALLLSAAPAGATAIASVSFNGATDGETEAATATAGVVFPGPTATGTATASADAPTGTLSARTGGESASGPGGFLDAQAAAEISEPLFLIPGPGSPSSPVPFTIFLDLDGVLGAGGIGDVGSLSLQLASARVIASLAISGLTVSGISSASFTATHLRQVAAGNVLDERTTVQLQQNTSGTVEETGLLDVRLTASATVTPDSAFTVRAVVMAESAADPGLSSLSDLSEPGRLSVVVPAGYSLVSSSGNFLTAPEPSAPSGAALGALAALALLRKRLAPKLGSRRAQRADPHARRPGQRRDRRVGGTSGDSGLIATHHGNTSRERGPSRQ
jgi:hypothetical protein